MVICKEEFKFQNCLFSMHHTFKKVIICLVYELKCMKDSFYTNTSKQ